MTLTPKQQLGNKAEDYACQYLQQRGLKMIRRNYRCKVGEIDIVMRSPHCLIFVEVRCRKPSRFGNAADSVNTRKQHKLVRTALHYLQRYKINLPCRFDVMAITPQLDETLDVVWIQDAFRVEY